MNLNVPKLRRGLNVFLRIKTLFQNFKINERPIQHEKYLSY